MDSKNNVVLYGIAGADKQYMALSYYVFYDGNPGVSEKRKMACAMKMYNPSIKQVFEIDNRPGLRMDFIRSQKLKSIESCIIFKDILERYGNEVHT